MLSLLATFFVAIIFFFKNASALAHFPVLPHFPSQSHAHSRPVAVSFQLDLPACHVAFCHSIQQLIGGRTYLCLHIPGQLLPLPPPQVTRKSAKTHYKAQPLQQRIRQSAPIAAFVDLLSKSSARNFASTTLSRIRESPNPRGRWAVQSANSAN